MSRVFIGLVLVMFAVTMGCTCGGGGGKSGAEAAAKEILDGMLAGKADAFLDHMDWEGMQKKMKEQGQDMSIADLRKTIGEPMAEGIKTEVTKGAEYKIEGTEEKEGVTIVKVKARKSKDAEWEDLQFAFENIGGKWLITEKSAKFMEKD